MTLDDLERVLGKHRQVLPLDPPGWRTRTVGGVLATNASGPGASATAPAATRSWASGSSKPTAP